MNDLKHIAIIMDGNGRWARERNRKRIYGHQMGLRNLFNLVRYLNDNDYYCLSCFCFSTENWRRPEQEVNYLLRLFKFSLKKIINTFSKENIKIQFSGTQENLSNDLINLCKKATDLTAHNTGLILNICFNYGARQELVEATKEICKDVSLGLLTLNQINCDTINNRLYTNNLPDVDFLIRTGKEKRLSNFLLYQSAYAELYFTDVYFPDFNVSELKKAIEDYQSRKRRFGGLDNEN